MLSQTVQNFVNVLLIFPLNIHGKQSEIMAKKAVLLLCLTLFLGGCSIIKNSNTLNGFCERMNTCYNSTDFSVTGYIMNKEEKRYSKFFIADENEIYLDFSYDDDKNLQSETLTFFESSLKSEKALNFIKNCILSFTFNSEEVKSYIENDGFLNTLKAKSPDTKKEQLGNYQLLVDVTEPGIVLTVIPNNTR